MKSTRTEVSAEESPAASSPDRLEEAIPFAELFAPWVEGAAEEVFACYGFTIEQAAMRSLQDQLVRQLSSICAVPLLWWFALFRTSPSLPENGPRRERYPAFVRWMHEDGWPDFLTEYPGLTTLIRDAIDGWSASTKSFLTDLQRDREALGKWLNIDAEGIASFAVSGSLSDHHRGQRSVLCVRFQGGSRVAYKPRPLTPEIFLGSVLKWIAARDASLELYCGSAVSYGEHGWMRWVEPSAPDNPAVYYERAGMLQCVFQALGTRDAHMANCIATSASPVLVDCECLLTPRLTADESGVEQRACDEACSTGLLSYKRPPEEPDLSGLTGRGGQATSYVVPSWSGTNTDAMRVEFRKARLRKQANSVPGAISKFAAGESMVRGFSKMHLFLSAHRDELLRDRTLADAIQPASLRVLIRDTRTYTELLSRSLRPEYLRLLPRQRKDVMRQWLTEKLLPLPTAAKDSILDAEAVALCRLDVPHFHTQATSRDLRCDGVLIASSLFAESGWECFLLRLSRFTPEALAERRNALRLLWMMSL